MKRPVVVAILMIVVLLVSATSGFAWVGGGGGVRHGGWQGHGGWHGGWHGRGVVVVGPGCCWGPWWGWGWGGYYPGPYYYPEPQVVIQPAPVYVDNSAPAESYWYYCPSSKAYYPSAPSCSEAWIKVPPRSE
ncbi:MAG: hypothetical protein DMD87_26055 [Candidatus Rokuibacteriota bacterium]|nr:MAG: hypothetical protein DMD87_26055 [Candidatus Rokubacteria bacterium]